MEAKQKANQLFCDCMRFFNGNNKYKKKAFQIARYTVNQIALSNPHSNPLNTDPVFSTISYWADVLEELNKIEDHYKPFS